MPRNFRLTLSSSYCPSSLSLGGAAPASLGDGVAPASLGDGVAPASLGGCARVRLGLRLINPRGLRAGVQHVRRLLEHVAAGTEEEGAERGVGVHVESLSKWKEEEERKEKEEEEQEEEEQEEEEQDEEEEEEKQEKEEEKKKEEELYSTESLTLLLSKSLRHTVSPNSLKVALFFPSPPSVESFTTTP